VIRLLADHIVSTAKSLLKDASTKRSPLWSALEKKFLIDHPFCSVCGTNKRLQVHHKVPFHLKPELELDPKNLMTLCMTMERACHLKIGHGNSFRAYYPKVDEAVKLSKGVADHFDALVLAAKKDRCYVVQSEAK
jgi:5-methylcytosine-specific restriction enzyme A